MVNDLIHGWDSSQGDLWLKFKQEYCFFYLICYSYFIAFLQLNVISKSTLWYSLNCINKNKATFFFVLFLKLSTMVGRLANYSLIMESNVSRLETSNFALKQCRFFFWELVQRNLLKLYFKRAETTTNHLVFSGLKQPCCSLAIV